MAFTRQQTTYYIFFPAQGCSTRSITSENTTTYGGFYSLGIDPSTNEIYVGDAIDHKQNGHVKRFSRSGKLLDEFKVGISPGNFSFKTE